MALKVELKPHEKIIVGSCVITNTDQRAKFLIAGERLPVLREKDILTPETADTPAKLIYLAVQLMYISHDPQEHHAVYFDVMRDFLSAVPTAGMSETTPVSAPQTSGRDTPKIQKPIPAVTPW